MVKGGSCQVLVQSCCLCSPSKYDICRGTTGAVGLSPIPKGGYLIVKGEQTALYSDQIPGKFKEIVIKCNRESLTKDGVY